MSCCLCSRELSHPSRLYHTGSSGALQQRSSSLLSLPAYVLKLSVTSLSRLPDPPIAFYWPQFRLRVWGQRAPGRLGAEFCCGAGGSLCGAHIVCYPEGPYAAVHPLLQRLTHQPGFTLGFLHGGLVRRQLQHRAQLLIALLQVQVTWRTCVEPAVHLCK